MERIGTSQNAHLDIKEKSVLNSSEKGLSEDIVMHILRSLNRAIRYGTEHTYMQNTAMQHTAAGLRKNGKETKAHKVRAMPAVTKMLMVLVLLFFIDITSFALYNIGRYKECQ